MCYIIGIVLAPKNPSPAHRTSPPAHRPRPTRPSPGNILYSSGGVFLYPAKGICSIQSFCLGIFPIEISFEEKTSLKKDHTCVGMVLIYGAQKYHPESVPPDFSPKCCFRNKRVWGGLYVPADIYLGTKLFWYFFC